MVYAHNYGLVWMIFLCLIQYCLNGRVGYGVSWLFTAWMRVRVCIRVRMRQWHAHHLRPASHSVVGVLAPLAGGRNPSAFGSPSSCPENSQIIDFEWIGCQRQELDSRGARGMVVGVRSLRFGFWLLVSAQAWGKGSGWGLSDAGLV